MLRWITQIMVIGILNFSICPTFGKCFQWLTEIIYSVVPANLCFGVDVGQLLPPSYNLMKITWSLWLKAVKSRQDLCLIFINNYIY